MIDRTSRSYLSGFALGCAIVLFGLFAIAIFGKSPYSIVALAVTPIPLVGAVVAAVVNFRRVIATLRSRSRPDLSPSTSENRKLSETRSAVPKRSIDDKEWNEVIVPRLARERAARERAVAGREQLVTRVAKLLFDDDPIHINFETNTDEYVSEAQRIVIELPDIPTASELQKSVHAIFVRQFDAATAGEVSRYEQVSRDIWRAWVQTVAAENK